jgi:hypothetical protein
MSADTLAALVAERDWIMGLINAPGVTVDDVPEGLGEFVYQTPSGTYRVKIEQIEGPS